MSPVSPQGAAAAPRKPAVPAVATPAAPSGAAAPAGAVANAPLETPPRALPGAENAGKPGYYTVKPGDTLIRIGLENGQSYRDIARWNALENPNRIEVGQVLRVVPPASAQAAARPVAPAVTPVAGSQVAAAPLSRASAPAAAAAPPGPASPDDDVTWMWPASGPVIAGFDEQKNKGVDLAGSAGDPVLAAADGRVVYVGAGLRGYGNLIILKHNNPYLTAYAHNQTLLIKEDQTVRRGQKIAEMGSSDADRVKLHFEVRRQGKPVDPTKYLPPR
ncbi:MAG: LysM peptidoglycan-binding domain-containing protein [Rhodoferax sp.]|nr:LysM peptidoglycan-binding domain-containing protein [Rhodoferax sp.]